MTGKKHSDFFSFSNVIKTANDLLSSPMDDLVAANDDSHMTDVAGNVSSPGISTMSMSTNENSAVHPPLVTQSPSVVRQSVSPTFRMSSTNQSSIQKKRRFIVSIHIGVIAQMPRLVR